ncbi:TetR/AcrR family transcriptional regulator [Rhodococcus sp. 14C212]|uniref:TetR/AcrR family transcriptional regulator n=1 Tax=Rhodococcus sp. 14C212 TaxID=2711209 RepID=UPI0013ED5858|nr:TetR/AcrR family transcriptional regulator [Rhodococcus sp. 14C212]NGP09034.1 TetR/AcrR family transcriptional regulator [Rhodococcus sp. 14C212]
MPHLPNTTKGRRTRTKLLEAARSVFARVGYVGATMSGVATEAGMSLGGLYRYFSDKEDLFAALIADTHDDLFRASGATEHRIEDDPYQALLEANTGYLTHYYDNRDIMRTLVEAASVDPRFREFWWQMRNRHVDRFTTVLRLKCGMEAVDGIDVRGMVEAVACMVEQSAYVWYAQEELQRAPMPLDQAAQIVTRIWHAAFFGNRR